MNIRWEKLIARLVIWIATEIWLGMMGLDTLADYSEFYFDQEWFFNHPEQVLVG